jgi:O-antigen/teichoic acid export membrane protein
MEDKSSYRRILRSSSIIGGASFINIAVGLVRTKVLAILLGPIGVGLTSLYTGFVTTAGTFATLGVGTVGTRQIAEAFSKDDQHALYTARRAMFWGTMVLAAASTLVVWTLRRILAVFVLGNASYSSAIAWLSLGVALTVAAASQGALIQGMRRIADLARVTVFASVLNTVIGVTLLWWLGRRGLIAYVLIGPLMTFLLGHFYVSRLPKLETDAVTVVELAREWASLLRLGLAFVGATLAGSLVQLWIRIYVGKRLGTSSLGQYQAAWTISMQYVSFVLTAMASDYYPRLTGVIRNRDAASRLVNEQTEIAMLLSTPVFVAMMAMAPWVMHLLYSALFAPAVELLRWQVLGDVLKVASWPLGFVILAAGDGKTYFWAESVTNLLTALVVATLLPVLGLRITGIAYLVTYVFYLPLVYWLARRRIGFHWSRAVLRLVAVAFVACTAAGSLALLSRWGIVIGCALAVWFGVFALGRISHMGALGGPVGKLGELARRFTVRRRP